MNDTDEKDLSIKEVYKIAKETTEGLKAAKSLFETQWGRLVENLIEGDLIRILNERDILVDKARTRLKGSYEGRIYEFDIVANDNRDVVVVEVKTNLNVTDVNHFMDKLNNFKKWMPEYRGRKVYGAVAYIGADESTEKYAKRKGLFIIKASGKAKIMNENPFIPKVF